MVTELAAPPAWLARSKIWYGDLRWYAALRPAIPAPRISVGCFRRGAIDEITALMTDHGSRGYFPGEARIIDLLLRAIQSSFNAKAVSMSMTGSILSNR